MVILIVCVLSYHDAESGATGWAGVWLPILRSVLMIQYFMLFFSCLLLMVPACKKNSDPVTTLNLLVQLDTPSSLHATILEEIVPIINASIKQELGLDEGYEFEFFMPKHRQVITIYYLRDVQDGGVQELLTTLGQTAKSHWYTLNDAGIALAPKIEFFAGPFGQSDELVMMIDDPHGKLLALHTELQSLLHEVDDRYGKVHAQSLYDSATSEQHPYVPHIGLGRIRSTSIKERCKRADQFKKIQECIKQDVTPVVQRLCAKINRELYIKALDVFDLQKKTVLREYLLAPEGQ